jgi:hypothetical protein
VAGGLLGKRDSLLGIALLDHEQGQEGHSSLVAGVCKRPQLLDRLPRSLRVGLDSCHELLVDFIRSH